MKTIDDQPPQTYLNVTEELVQAEIRKQLKDYPYGLAKYINQVEVATYALNRLPPLYASCEKGKHQQKLLGQRQYKNQIQTAVRQGLAAVQRDPLRTSTPLISEVEVHYRASKAALLELQKFLEERELTDYEKLTWDNLVCTVRQALNRVMHLGYRSVKPPIHSNESVQHKYGLSDEEIQDKHGFTASTYFSSSRGRHNLWS